MISCSSCPTSAKMRSGSGGQLQRERDVVVHQALQHLVHAADGLVQIDHARLPHLLATEREQLLGQLARAPPGARDLLDIGAQRVLRPQAARDQRGVTQDHRQQVVEVVRDAAGELPDRIHLLRLAQLFFEAAAIVDVLQRAVDARDHALRVALGLTDRPHPDPASVTRGDLKLEVERCARARALVDARAYQLARIGRVSFQRLVGRRRRHAGRRLDQLA
jgi:hypothetical protein